MSLFLAPTATRLPEWIRQAAQSVNYLLRKIGYLGSSRSVTGDTSVVDADHILLVDATAGPVTISLPPATVGRTLAIKKLDSSANAVTIAANGAETIDDAATMVISTQYHSRTLWGVAGAWWVI